MIFCVVEIGVELFVFVVSIKQMNGTLTYLEKHNRTKKRTKMMTTKPFNCEQNHHTHLYCNTVYTDCYFHLFRFDFVTTFRFLNLLGKLQPPNCLFDYFNTFGLLDRSASQKLQSINETHNYLGFLS